jgi:hypothetical protein
VPIVPIWLVIPLLSVVFCLGWCLGSAMRGARDLDIEEAWSTLRPEDFQLPREPVGHNQ